MFEDTTPEKYINLFTFDNNIKFDNIMSYELTVYVLSLKNIIFKVNQVFTVNEHIHIYKDSSLYIEITKNSLKDNYANCCIHITTDKSRLFFTPPGY